MFLADRARELDAPLAGQLDVHEDDLRPAVTAERPPHLLAAPRRRDDADRPSPLETLPQSVAEDRVVVDDQDLDRLTHAGPHSIGSPCAARQWYARTGAAIRQYRVLRATKNE